MPDYGVRTIFTAKNAISPEMARMASESDKLARKFRSVGEVFKGSFLGTAVSNAFTASISHVYEGIKGSAREFARLDENVNRAAMRFGNVEYGSRTFKDLEKTARELGRTTSFSAVEVAEAESAMAKSNFSVAASMKILPGLAEFAEASNLSIADSATIAAHALKQFNMNSPDADVQARNWKKISDVSLAAKVNLESFHEAAARGGGYLLSSGQSIETFAALEKAFEGVGAGGGQAGLAMKSMVSGLEKLDDPKKAGVLRKMGLSREDIRLGGDNLLEVLYRVQQRYNQLQGGQKIGFLQQVFGSRGLNAVALVMNQGIERVGVLKNKLDAAEGTTERLGKQIEKSLTERMEKLDKAVTEKGFQVFEKVLTGGNGGIEGMVSAINKFDVTPIANGVKAIGEGLSFVAKHSDGIASIAKSALIIKGAFMVTDTLKWAKAIPAMFGGIAATAPAIASVAGSAEKIGRQAAMSAGGTTGVLGGFQTVMWGGTRSESMWNGRRVVGPKTGGVPIRMGIEIPPEKSKMTGAQISDGFSAAMAAGQAAAIGLSIGSAINDSVKDAGKGAERDRNNLIKDADEARRLLQQNTPESLEAARRKISGIAGGALAPYEGVEGKFRMAGEFLASTLGYTEESPLELAQKKLEAVRRLSGDLGSRTNKLTAGYFTPEKFEDSRRTDDVFSALKALDKQEVTVKIELTGDGAKGAHVVSTQSNGETAPRVNKGRAGRQ